MMRSSRIRWGVVAAIMAAVVVGLVALVQFFLGPLLGYSCDVPAKPMADMRSMDDLRTRFNDDAGSPRLVLLLSPT